jgi:hypothetical protein
MKRAFVNEPLAELARRASFMAVDAADHLSGKSGETLPVTVMYPGTDVWVAAGNAADKGNGLYAPTGLTAAAQTVGTMFLHIAATANTDPVDFEMSIEAIIDLSNLDAAISTRSSHGAPDLANLDAPVSGCATPADIPAPPNVPTAQQNATALVSEVIEDNGSGTTWSLKAALRLLLAFMVGERSGGGTVTKTFKVPGGTKTRITMQTDNDGNSSFAHTLDAGDA